MKAPFEIMAGLSDTSTQTVNLLSEAMREFDKSTDICSKKMLVKGLSPLQITSVHQKHAGSMRLLARRIESIVPRLESSTQESLDGNSMIADIMPLFSESNHGDLKSLVGQHETLLVTLRRAGDTTKSFRDLILQQGKDIVPLAVPAKQLASALDKVIVVIDMQIELSEVQVSIVETRLEEIG